MVERPAGTVTFMFTDVEGSTGLWDRYPVEMEPTLRAHDEILRTAIGAADGVVFATGGDGFAAAFARADAAVRAAVEAQRALSRCRWPAGLSLKVRMGLHTGEAYEHDGDYVGPAVNLAARVMDAANGSQILLTSSTRDVVRHELEASVAVVDLGSHELRDVIEPVRLFRLNGPDFGGDRRPPRTGSVRAGNLPPPTGTLVGRDSDVEAVIADLVSSPVVTLTGVGGIGKTSLAVAVGRRLQPTLRDGVWFVALDTVVAADELVPALLGALTINRASGTERDSLIDGLRFREALVILDNCEHLLEVVAEVASLIVGSCPNVRLLTTSREPLDIDGERIRRVRSLDADEGGPAVELFRLRADEAGVRIDGARDDVAIARICHRLDGIPLAIELAAARARSLRPPEIADRLDDMFGLLTGGRRASVERHRTLRATLEWSHELLGAAERILLARMSIFAGSFSLAAAEAIGAADPVPQGQVVDLLDRLVAQSLVVPVDDSEESRFRVLEPVRQLAAETLAARGETDATREAHTQWYLDLLTGLSDRWRAGDDQGTWPVARRELANLRAAFDRLLETARIDDAQRFAVAGFGPLACHSNVEPNTDWAPRSLALDPDHVGPSTAGACSNAAWGAISHGDLDEAAAWVGRGADAIARGSVDDGLVMAAGFAFVRFGGWPVLSDAFQAATLDGALRSDDLHRKVWVLGSSGRFDEAVSVARRLGNKMLYVWSLWGVLAQARDDAAEWEQLELIRDAALASNSVIMINHSAQRLGWADIRAGSYVSGLLTLRTPAREWLFFGDQRVWDVLHTIATGLAAAGDAATAARLRGAVGAHRLNFVSDAERSMLQSLLDASVSADELARYERAGQQLDAGAAVDHALEAIETLAVVTPPEAERADSGASTLTDRQYEVAMLIARGQSNKQIAQQLGVSRYTAETHVRNILERLGATSRAEIAAWATRQPQR